MKPGRIVGIQYAALPYRIEGGRVRILLITSRETRRWIIPKGWPMDGLLPADAAAAEAAEEAGIIGKVEGKPIGSYRYVKRLKRERSTAVQVIVFPFHVVDQAKAWKEQGERDLAWFDPWGAARRVAEPSLKRLILDFGAARAPSFVARQLRRYRAWRFGPAAMD